jgi:hypothetical protein
MLSGLVFGAPPVPYGSTPYGPYQRPGYGSYSAPPPYSPYGLGGNGYGYAYPYKRPFDYDRAMHRLDQQEAQAMARAARRSYGNPARYNDRMAKIEHKYAYKRYTVEQNASHYGYGYR